MNSVADRLRRDGLRHYGRSFLVLDRTITNISPQMTSAVIPKKIQSDANSDWVSTAADVITRASDEADRVSSREPAHPFTGAGGRLTVDQHLKAHVGILNH